MKRCKLYQFSETCLDSEDASLLKLLLQDNLDDALSSLGQSDCIPVPAPLPVPKSGQSQSLLPVYPNCGKSSPSTSTQIFKVRIAGGSDAGLGTYPWMALIGYSYKNSGDVQFGCGGTLINENYVSLVTKIWLYIVSIKFQIIKCSPDLNRSALRRGTSSRICSVRLMTFMEYNGKPFEL